MVAFHKNNKIVCELACDKYKQKKKKVNSDSFPFDCAYIRGAGAYFLN